MFRFHAIRRFITPSTAAVLLSAVLGAASISGARAQTTGPEPTDPTPVRELESLRMATFRIGTLSEVRMVGVAEIDEVSVGEVIPAGPNEKFLIDPTTHPVDVFALLAPAGTPVPRMIAALDERGILADRRIVESLDEPIEVAPESLGIRARLALKVGAGSCQIGDPGGDYFEDHHCGTLGGPGYGGSESSCDRDSSNFIDTDTNNRRRATYTRFASCGGGDNRMRHFYGTISGWDTQVSETFGPGQVVSWWSSYTGVKRHRRTIFEDIEPDGWVRGWTKFHSEVAGGW